ncbi:nuclear transport factor 2 family protein [Longispora urticae]
MSDATELVGRYLASWNETDPAARRAAIEEIWTADAVYIDPLVSVQGRDAVDAVIGAVQAQFPGLVFTLVGTVDAHHDLARFQWGLGPVGAEPIVVGFDVVTLVDGRIGTVHGFLDRVPTA